MKVQSSKIVNVGEVSTEGNLRLDAMFNIFQEMAVLHTHRIGIELNDFLSSGKTWVLNRFVVQVDQLPRLEDAIEIHTWSRKIYRFKGYREFEIYAQDRPIIKASSLWVYVDTRKGRPVRVPDDYEGRYGVVDQQSTGVDIEGIDFVPISNPDYSLQVATRISDFDINGHVNNAVMLQYIETALVRLRGNDYLNNDISLIFTKEIPFTVREVRVDLQKTEHGCLFEVSNGDLVFAQGTIMNQNTQ